MKRFRRSLMILLAFGLVGACAMQRAVDAGDAQKQMIGLSREQVFSCMGIPKKKAIEGDTEIWAYTSGNKRQDKTKNTSSITKNFTNTLTGAFGFEDEVRDMRFCTVQIVMKNDAVTTVHYSGPTGGFLTEDEQCAYAVRNCLKN